MKLVVDSNVLFSFFKAESFTRGIIVSNRSLELVSPEVTLSQLAKYSGRISSKAGLSKEGFEEVFSLLALYIEFIPVGEYDGLLKKAEKLTKGWPSNEYAEFKDDIDFFALALKEGCAIWSNDKLFKKQDAVKVVSTEELSRLLSALA